MFWLCSIKLLGTPCAQGVAISRIILHLTPAHPSQHGMQVTSPNSVLRQILRKMKWDIIDVHAEKFNHRILKLEKP